MYLSPDINVRDYAMKVFEAYKIPRTSSDELCCQYYDTLQKRATDMRMKHIQNDIKSGMPTSLNPSSHPKQHIMAGGLSIVIPRTQVKLKMSA